MSALNALIVWPYGGYAAILLAVTAWACRAANRRAQRPASRVDLALILFAFVAMYAATGTQIAFWAECCLSSALMAQFLLLWMVAPPLILTRFRGALPPPLGVWRPILRAVTHPMIGLCGSVLLNYMTYLGPLHRLALATTWSHALFAVLFFVLGLIFWFPVLEPIDNPYWRQFPPTGQVFYLVGASIITKPLGLLLMFATHPITPELNNANLHPFGLGPILDQQIAGGELIFVCGFVLLAGIVPPVVRLMNAEERRAEAYIRRQLRDLPASELERDAEKN